MSLSRREVPYCSDADVKPGIVVSESPELGSLECSATGSLVVKFLRLVGCDIAGARVVCCCSCPPNPMEPFSVADWIIAAIVVAMRFSKLVLLPT